MPAGRPTKYRPEYHPDKTFKFALLGLTDKEMADIFEVSEQTFNEWKKVHPEFLESLKKGKHDADAEIAKSLYHRAKGYSHPETKFFQYEGKIIEVETIKHYPPDTGSMVVWLKNRKRKLWPDKQQIDATVANVTLKIDDEDAGTL